MNAVECSFRNAENVCVCGHLKTVFHICKIWRNVSIPRLHACLFACSFVYCMEKTCMIFQHLNILFLFLMRGGKDLSERVK